MSFFIPARQLTPGCTFELDSETRYEHAIGGSHNIAGADCPNCRLPLILHCTLDVDDPLLNIPNRKTKLIPLLYCMRCPLAWFEFSYRVTNSSSIRICEAFTENRFLKSRESSHITWPAAIAKVRKEWESYVGVSSWPRRSLGFRPYSERLQQLFDKAMSAGLKKEEKDECQLLLNGYSRQIPIVPQPINQMGGIPYCPQGVPTGCCLTCLQKKDRARPMRIVMSLTNEPLLNLKVSVPSVQILFLICLKCYTVTAINRLS